jgi:hypothetical protein
MNPYAGGGGRLAILRLPLLKEPRPPGKAPERPCPICGERWRPAAGRVLPCHARCLFHEQAQDDILDGPDGPVVVARHLGVPVKVIDAAMTAARKRRKT